jgi:hypothetical protein
MKRDTTASSTFLVEEARPVQLEGARKAGPLVIDATAEDVTEEKVEW